MPIKYLTYETVRYAPSDEIAPRTQQHKIGSLVYTGRLGIDTSKRILIARVWRGRVEKFVNQNDLLWYIIRPVGCPTGVSVRVAPFCVQASRHAARLVIIEMIDTFQHALVTLEKKF